MRLSPLLAILLTSVSVLSAAEFRITDDAVIAPTDQTEGATALATPDDFTRELSEFDRASRLRSASIPTPEDYLKYVAHQALPWGADEIAKLESVFDSIRARFAPFTLPLPKRILLIKTTGREEGAASYCRGPNVVIPKQVAAGPVAELQDTLTHELFHILSKSNPELRNRLYKVIGFEPCTKVVIPDELKHRLITNPDAPRPHHFTTVIVDGHEVRIVPMLFSRLDHYDPSAGGSFFDSLAFKFMAVIPVKGLWISETKGGKTWLMEPSEAGDFLDRVGPDPGLILQPEEILASYFVPLVSAYGKGVPKKIAEGMRACFHGN